MLRWPVWVSLMSAAGGFKPGTTIASGGLLSTRRRNPTSVNQRPSIADILSDNADTARGSSVRQSPARGGVASTGATAAAAAPGDDGGDDVFTRPQPRTAFGGVVADGGDVVTDVDVDRGSGSASRVRGRRVMCACGFGNLLSELVLMQPCVCVCEMRVDVGGIVGRMCLRAHVYL